MSDVIRTRAPQRLERRQNRYGYLFLAPWLIGFLVFALGPMLGSLYFSFTDFDLFNRPSWVGLANYVDAFTADERFWNSLWVTAIYVGLSVPAKLVVALVIALALNRRVGGISFYRAAFYLPSLLGGSVAVAVLWREVFGSDGLVNAFLAIFGLQGPSWVADPDYAVHALVLLAIWQFGSPMIIFLAGLKEIPRQLYEAADLDGAGPVRRFLRITFPMLTPLVFFNLVLQMIGAFQAFTPAFIISGGSGGPSDSTLFYTLYLYQQGFTNFRMGYASAMAWILFGIIALFTALLFFSARYWVHYGDEAD